MKKYYIYLNEKKYMEMPKEYNIKKDVYVKSNDTTEQALNYWGYPAVANWDGTIWVKRDFLQNPRWHAVLKHELRHTKQMKESDVGRQDFLRKLRSPELLRPKSHIEGYIEPFAKEVRRLRLGEELSYKDRYQLFRKLTSPKGKTVHTKHPYEVDAIKWEKKNIQLKRALDEVLKGLRYR